MLTADVLSRLYSKHVLCADGNPDCPMLIMGNLQEGFSPGTPIDIQEKVLKTNICSRMYMALCTLIIPNGDTIPYVPSTQKIDTVLQYHRDLGKPHSRNLHEYLKTRYWWPNMLDDIREVLEQCKVCEKYAVVIHMCAVLQARVYLASNKDNMLNSDNVWLAGNAVN
ncbi:hypothetical protein DSO57_1029171 [Entomophthora muscae]|uniref:Uncharacterized protein n=1 Tax=Entomophthora muscae TaxID=34485 RepID=A0ACC2RS55_9FUNG|nr:hypothetical protein DSO57_1029171 [Entomophthora muscae]